MILRFFFYLFGYVLLTVTDSSAFHEGGVGYCDGCHTLHGSQTNSSSNDTGSALLNASDPSSTCLSCHAEASHPYSIYNVTTPARLAGGDFSWLKDANSDPGMSGNRRGHNVIAVDFGLLADDVHSHAPGGDYPATELQCISCHDPHGKIADNNNPAAISGSGSYGEEETDADAITGNFRLLAGRGYLLEGQTSGFTNDAPVAVAPLAGSGSETDGNHTAYGQGMSEWCANCHAELLNQSLQSGSTMHPSGSQAKLDDKMIHRYNSYLRTGGFSGEASTAYSSLVPFETGTNDVTQLDPASTSGPDQNSNVMCLTCHRAHASAFANSGRWDFNATLLAATYQSDAYYGVSLDDKYGAYQRQLCAKCHPYD